MYKSFGFQLAGVLFFVLLSFQVQAVSFESLPNAEFSATECQYRATNLAMNPTYLPLEAELWLELRSSLLTEFYMDFLEAGNEDDPISIPVYETIELEDLTSVDVGSDNQLSRLYFMFEGQDFYHGQQGVLQISAQAGPAAPTYYACLPVELLEVSYLEDSCLIDPAQSDYSIGWLDDCLLGAGNFIQGGTEVGSDLNQPELLAESASSEARSAFPAGESSSHQEVVDSLGGEGSSLGALASETGGCSVQSRQITPAFWAALFFFLALLSLRNLRRHT